MELVKEILLEPWGRPSLGVNRIRMKYKIYKLIHKVYKMTYKIISYDNFSFDFLKKKR